MNNKIRFTKIRDVKSPTRNQGDAGSDFYVPEYSDEFKQVLYEKNENNNISIYENNIYIGAHSQILIPSGIKVDIIDNYSDKSNFSVGFVSK